MSNGSPLYGRRAYEAYDGMERNGKWRKPTQHELDDWKSSLAPGTRIYVYGWGEGTVRGFIKSSGWGVHSQHEIELRAEDRYARGATGRTFGASKMARRAGSSTCRRSSAATG